MYILNLKHFKNYTYHKGYSITKYRTMQEHKTIIKTDIFLQLSY